VHIYILCIYVCLISTFELTDNFYDIWCERYVTKGRRKLVHFNFLQSVITTWRTHEIVMGATLASLSVGSWNDIW